ncbi:MAG: carbohydrate ABC transporter permease [Planctomycetes bacterium]|nr:carbohydrate ABC transporter permease [Planctomycetota bacterium]
MLWPRDLSLESYARAQKGHGVTSLLINSLIVAGGTTLITIPIAALAAYALARLKLRGRRVILSLILVASMFPQVALVHTLYGMIQVMGLVNTRPGLSIPYVMLTLPLAIWILASFFKEIPEDLEDAARIDGCGPVRTLVSVFMPVAAPGVFTAAILTFIYAWNEFFFALVLLTDPARQTLPRGIALMPGRFTIPWGEIAAASVIATLPLVILVLVLQRRIISGLTAGAVKG